MALQTAWIKRLIFPDLSLDDLQQGEAGISLQKPLSYQADGIEVHTFSFFEFVSSVA